MDPFGNERDIYISTKEKNSQVNWIKKYPTWLERKQGMGWISVWNFLDIAIIKRFTAWKSLSRYCLSGTKAGKPVHTDYRVWWLDHSLNRLTYWWASSWGQGVTFCVNILCHNGAKLCLLSYQLWHVSSLEHWSPQVPRSARRSSVSEAVSVASMARALGVSTSYRIPLNDNFSHSRNTVLTF